MGSLFFFFQAEDGIRDLVRSRGLGDVYKRQEQDDRAEVAIGEQMRRRPQFHPRQHRMLQRGVDAVSYTHLTLPTSDLV